MRSRVPCGAIGAGLIVAGAVAVFLTENEIGSAGLLVTGAFFAMIAVLGHVPRLKWGDTEVDPTQLAYAVGVSRGAEEVNDAAQELLETLPDNAGAVEALDTFKEALAAREVERALHTSERSPDPGLATLAEDAARLGITRERVRQLRLRAEQAGLGHLPTEVFQILTRFAGFNAGVDHFAVARQLDELGYEGLAPRSQAAGSGPAYVRWVYEGTTRTVRLYQNSAGLISDSKPQLEFATRLKGAEVEGGVHPKVRFYYEDSSVADVVEAARRFKSLADSP